MSTAVPIPAVRVTNVTRAYMVNNERVLALRHVNLTVEEGAFVALMGRSGSGKTTLLNMIGGLDQPTEGEVALFGQVLNGMDQDQLTLLRREKIGFIFQSFALLPILSAWENVEMPLRIAGVRSGRERRQRAEAALALVGLERWATHRPAEMSGGQQQRVAIARALVSRPRLLLADEPTGELDSTTGRNLLTLLRTIVRTEGVTLIMATHDRTIFDFADIVYQLRDGQIVE
ncbi:MULTISPECIES: ABC transporter ATP-binding protein [Roseiflexus]|jgi:ABC-type lipoprotein export system ATPase subunit|uniref:ABC transporter related n=1 Tax=Roseiflexus castenholzii (strain DSM 13941 / HLO8) TaxID=383372 RepID=A7NS32_ROSCS|nr:MULTISPECIES: ABC transporter ATP-binding protein [Roseiflexus]ABU60378.1 ABC transporter related [Roseiflexus castenholzii DSM 13941]GIV98760.1 MAG: ABC transporter ATP-binding protein [Roseiflexus sp.]